MKVLKLFIVLFVCSCICVGYHSNKEHIINDTVSEITPQKLKLTLAREECYQGQWDVCGSGRGYPVFVHLNKSDYLSSYDTVIYSLLIGTHWLDSFNLSYSDITSPIELDSKFDQFDSLTSNIVKVKTPNRYRRKVRHYQRKVDLGDKRFNGYFYYKMYEMEFLATPAGFQNVLLPDHKSGGFKMKKCQVYWILNIYNITPINAN